MVAHSRWTLRNGSLTTSMYLSLVQANKGAGLAREGETVVDPSHPLGGSIRR